MLPHWVRTDAKPSVVPSLLEHYRGAKEETRSVICICASGPMADKKRADAYSTDLLLTFNNLTNSLDLWSLR